MRPLDIADATHKGQQCRVIGGYPAGKRPAGKRKLLKYNIDGLADGG